MNELILAWRGFMEDWKGKHMGDVPDSVKEKLGYHAFYKPTFYDFMEWLSTNEKE